MAQDLEVITGNSIQAGSRGLVLRSIQDIQQFCICVNRSGFAPRGNNSVEGMIVSIAMGMELGLSPMQAIQNICPINGKPSVYGDAINGLILASGLCNGWKEFFEGTEGTDDFTAVCQIHRVGFAEPFVQRFSVRDAKLAGLWGKQGPWKTNPKRMLQMRARGFCARDGFADVLKGLISREEAEDYPEPADTTTPPVTYEMARSEVIQDAAPAPTNGGYRAPDSTAPTFAAKKATFAEIESLEKRLGYDGNAKRTMKERGYGSLAECPTPELNEMRDALLREIEQAEAALAQEQQGDAPFDMDEPEQPQPEPAAVASDDAPEW